MTLTGDSWGRGHGQPDDTQALLGCLCWGVEEGAKGRVGHHVPPSAASLPTVMSALLWVHFGDGVYFSLITLNAGLVLRDWKFK